jgi:hypothetical protein
MKGRFYARIVLALLCTLILCGGVLALPSASHRLDWFTPLTTGNGGPAASSHFAVNLTVGQTSIGTLSSQNYTLCLGYWCGAGQPYPLHLPLVTRHQQP